MRKRRNFASGTDAIFYAAQTKAGEFAQEKTGLTNVPDRAKMRSFRGGEI